MTCEEKLKQIAAIVKKANMARGNEREFEILGYTIGIIDGISSGRISYDREREEITLLGS